MSQGTPPRVGRDDTMSVLAARLDRIEDARDKEHAASVALAREAHSALVSALKSVESSGSDGARVKALEDWRGRLEEEAKAARVAWGPILASAIVGAVASGGVALVAWLVLRAASGG